VLLRERFLILTVDIFLCCLTLKPRAADRKLGVFSLLVNVPLRAIVWPIRQPITK